MSHFSVFVRVPSAVAFIDLETEVRNLLLPYKEFGFGEKEAPGYEKYLEFVDEEDEERKTYETGSCDMVRLASGAEGLAYDDRFRNPEAFSDTPYIYPDGSSKFEKPLREVFPTFEKYMKDYVGLEKRDPKMKRYGHWRNPNSKWDWYQIGGRFSGHLPVGIPRPERSIKCDPEKYERVNGCRISDLNFFSAERDAHAEAEKFWFEWLAFCAGREFAAFDGPRARALDLGLVECKNADELTGSEWKTIKWKRQIKTGVDRLDVLREISHDEFLSRFLPAFSPLTSWARLDSSGWKEKGKMGWWGLSSSTAESVTSHNATAESWLKSGNQLDWIVCVDCHI